MDAGTLYQIGLVLVFAGFALAFISAFIPALRGSRSNSRTKGGGIVMIGPFPIIFGTDIGSVKVLILLSILLMVAVLAFMWFTSLTFR